MKNKVKHYRELKGMSQEELAKASNISRTTISGLENDTIKVTTNTTMDKIANALEVSTIELFYTWYVQQIEQNNLKLERREAEWKL